MKTETFFGKLFSFLFNPLFMPLFGVIGVMYWSDDIAMVPILKRYVLIITAVFHAILPLFTLIVMKLFGLTPKLELPRRRDRLMPITLSFGYAIFGYFFLMKIPLLNPLFYLLPLGSGVVLLFAFLFTSRFQISIHLMSAGALTATYVLAQQFFGIDFFIPVILSIAVAGLTAFARISLNAHKPYQVYYGYLVGFASLYFSIVAFSYFINLL